MPDQITNAFAKMGATVEFLRPFNGFARQLDINILGRTRKSGEHFVITRGPSVALQVLQVVPDDRHLLLYTERPNAVGALTRRPLVERFLCGHDERHWFSAAVGAAVSTVRAAKLDLAPAALKADLERLGRNGFRRRNALFVRQGEWFFVPVTPAAERAALDAAEIHRREPLVRPGRRGGKPHYCDELVRVGGVPIVLKGETEYTEGEFAKLVADGTFAPSVRVRRFVKDATVYARGPVRHPDHATIQLPGWHRVYVNSEVSDGASMSFYD